MEYIKEVAKSITSSKETQNLVHAVCGISAFVILGAIYFRDLIA